MQAVILAGGLGTRLRDVVPTLPKPMAPIGEKPFLEYLLQPLKAAGITDILILTGFKAEIIEAYFGDGRFMDLSIRYSREPQPLGTGGSLLHAWPHLEETFLLINGDTFFDIQYDLLTDFAVQRNTSATMALRFSEDVSRYGSVQYDASYRVTSFTEKGALAPTFADGFINGGIYYFKRQCLMPFYSHWQGESLSLEQTVLPYLVGQAQLYGLPLGGKFIDIGTPASYAEGQTDIPACLAEERRGALFLDRDGVMIRDTGYPVGTDVVLLESAYEWVAEANENNRRTIVVTNQAGVAKGHFTEAQVQATHQHLSDVYRQLGLTIDAFFYCPYHPQGTVPAYRKTSFCRKPWPGLVLRAAEQYRIDFKKSCLIGDNPLVDRLLLPYLTCHIEQAPDSPIEQASSDLLPNGPNAPIRPKYSSEQQDDPTQGGQPAKPHAYSASKNGRQVDMAIAP